MSRERTVPEKVGDWKMAFDAIREQMTPPPILEMRDQLLKVPTDTLEVGAYAQLVSASLGIAKLVSANDRAAGVIAAMLTQSGVSRPQLDVIDGGEA